jgi:hypothetical protein
MFLSSPLTPGDAVTVSLVSAAISSTITWQVIYRRQIRPLRRRCRRTLSKLRVSQTNRTILLEQYSAELRAHDYTKTLLDELKGVLQAGTMESKAVLEEKNKLEVEIANLTTEAQCQVAIRAAELRTAKSETKTDLIKTLDIKRELKVLGQEGFWSNRYLVAMHEEVFLDGARVYVHTTESFWTSIDPNNLKNIMDAGLKAARVVGTAVQIAHGIPPKVN